MRDFFKKFGPPVGIYLVQLFGEKFLSSAQFDWLWPVLLWLAAGWLLLSVISIDKIWNTFFASWVPTIRCRIVWPSQRENFSLDWEDTRESVYRQHFRNVEVVIDRKAFEHCEFTNVTFTFLGIGPTSFLECKFHGTTLFQTNNQAAKAYAKLSDAFRNAPITASFVVAEKSSKDGELRILSKEERRIEVSEPKSQHEEKK